MSHTIHWLVEDRVILTTFHGIISADELKQFTDTVVEKAAAGTPPVYHVSNSLDLQSVEFSLGTARNMIGAREMLRYMAWQIDINTNPVNRMFANIISQFASMRTRTFREPQEAVDFIKSIDPSLTDATWHMELLTDDTSEQSSS